MSIQDLVDMEWNPYLPRRHIARWNTRSRIFPTQGNCKELVRGVYLVRGNDCGVANL